MVPLPSNISRVVWGSFWSLISDFLHEFKTAVPELSSPGMRHGVKTTATNENSEVGIFREGKTGEDLS